MHFAIAVITHGMPTEEDLEDLLAPFQENNMGTVREEYLEFCPIDEEEVNEYKEEYENNRERRSGASNQRADVFS